MTRTSGVLAWNGRGQPAGSIGPARQWPISSAADFREEELAGLGAWIAERQGDLKAEKHALEAMLAGKNPGDLAALERLAELAFREGREDEARRLRARKSELDASRTATIGCSTETVSSKRTPPRWRAWPPHSAETSRPGPSCRCSREEPGRPRRSRRTSGTSGRPAPPHSAASESLAKALLGRAGPARCEYRRPHPANPHPSSSFEDDAGSAGLAGFVLENGASPSHQLPEISCGGARPRSTTTATASSTSTSSRADDSRLPEAQQRDRRPALPQPRRRNLRRRIAVAAESAP